MRSKRLEKEEQRQAESVQNVEDLDAIQGKNVRPEMLNMSALDLVDDDLEDEEEEQAEDAMTGGA